MSVKFKLIAWFTLMMTVMAAFTLVVVFVVNDAAITGDPQGSLVDVVGDNADDLHMEDGIFDWDALDFYRHGVYTIVYDSDGNVLRGVEPLGLEIDMPFEEDAIRAVAYDDITYYIYDMHLDVIGSDGIWLRGVIGNHDSSYLMHVLIILLWAIVPSILVLSVGGGWLIAWNAFRPMEKIMHTAKSISDGDDLSKRIGLKRGPREMRRLAKTFDNMFDRLEKSFHTQKQFASDASHELRTPVTVMLAECDRAKRKNKTVEDYRATIDAVDEQAHRMSELIDELLNLTRIGLGTERYPLTATDLGGFTESVCDEFIPREERGISRNFSAEAGIMVMCNHALMASCINNLLQNAYKYGREGGHIEVTVTVRDRMAALSVKDDGVGIAAEDQDKVWNRFWQADSSRGINYGSGLGLSLVRESTELHGGRVELESKPGEGSVFTILLPLIK